MKMERQPRQPAVVECVYIDAMTTNRPYQQAMSFEAAADRINQLKGVALDERVVGAFNRAWISGLFRFESEASAPPFGEPQPSAPRSAGSAEGHEAAAQSVTEPSTV